MTANETRGSTASQPHRFGCDSPMGDGVLRAVLASGFEEERNEARATSGSDLSHDDQDIAIPPHRRKILRTRAAPAGPHPYLDRFASGMHLPLQGDDSSWRNASIQPVPIPDLGHTGIRTMFTPGAGNGFTPDGAMTDKFRTGIHDTIRNLHQVSPADARDMKTRDYAREIRKHRADPCGGSLLHAHMSSLELGTSASCTALRGGLSIQEPDRVLAPNTSVSMFQSRFSPPSSPASARRALIGGGSRGFGSKGSGGESGRASPDGDRQALLQREFDSVRMAAVGTTYDDSRNRGGGKESSRKYAAIGTCELTSKRVLGVSSGSSSDPERGRDTVSAQTMPASDYWRTIGCDKNAGTNSALPASDTRKARRRRRMTKKPADCSRGNGRQDNIDFGWTDSREGSRGEGFPDPEELGVDHPRIRGKRRARSSGRWSRREERIGSRGDSSGHGCGRTLLPSMSSPCFPKRPASFAKKKTRRKKKPFSSDSLFTCLLDMRYGNTRDLSPDKASGQQWDVRALPTGLTSVKDWDGFGPEEFDGSDEFERARAGDDRKLSV